MKTNFRNNPFKNPKKFKLASTRQNNSNKFIMWENVLKYFSLLPKNENKEEKNKTFSASTP